MEENLKKLLKEMIEQENIRNSELQNAEIRLEATKIQEETRIERFEQGFLEDVNSGLYNMTDGQIKKELDEGKAKISQEYESQRDAIAEDISKIKEEEEKENKNRNQKIGISLNKYKAELITDNIRLKRERRNLEQQKAEKLQELDKEKTEKEARYTHLIMRNRNVMDAQHRDSGDIMILASEIEQLNSQRDEIASSFDTQISGINSQEEIINNKLEKVNVFFSKLSEKTTSEIYEMFFEKEVQVKTSEEPNQKESSIQQSNEQEPSEQELSEQEPSKQEPSEQEPSEQEPSEQQPNPQEPSEQQPKPQMKSSVAKPISKKFSYEFSTKGIKYDGKDIDINDLLEWNEDHEEDIEAAIKEVMGDKEETEDFLDYSDKLIYTTIILQGSTVTKDGKIEIGPVAKERLKTYHDIWENPKSQDESNMSIKYNLKGTSAISRLFRKWTIIDEETFSKWEHIDEEMQNIRDNAFELRNRKNVTVEKGFLTKIQFRIREMLENQREVKKLDSPKQESKENSSHENFVERLNPENPEYSHVEENTNKTEKTVEPEKESYTR